MKSIKESALELIEELREDCTWEDVMYCLRVRQKIEAGIRDLEEGRTVSHDDVFREFRKMRPIESSGPVRRGHASFETLDKSLPASQSLIPAAAITHSGYSAGRR